MTGRIDWKEQFDQLAPLLQGHGKIVRVSYPDENCGHTTFTQALIKEYEAQGNSQWKSVVLDQTTYSTRYLEDVLAEFAYVLKTPQPVLPSPSITVAQGITAKGDVNVDISNVTFNQGTGQTGFSRNQAITALQTDLKAYLQGGGHLMVIVNHSVPEGQNEFWRHLWKKGLQPIVNDGLALVHLVMTSDHNGRPHDLAPAPDISVFLPNALSPEAQKHAVEDIAAILEKLDSPGPKDPYSWAEGLMAGVYNDIPKLHEAVTSYVMRTKQGTSN